MAIDLTKYRINILCEDIAQFDFIRAYAQLLGVSKRKIVKLTEANNNATVLKHYPEAVNSYRKVASENVILVVMIDADNKTVKERLREFDQKLDAKKYRLNQDARSDTEKILIFIPIRNIESWFRYIDRGSDVENKKNEEGKIVCYKDKYQEADISQLAKKLKEEICVRGLPENAPSSLHHACRELARL